MDRVGTYMCLATVPMALLTLLSAMAGVALVVMGHGQIVGEGLAAFAFCLVLAPALERLVVAFDEAAAQMLARRGRQPANLIAIGSGAIPVAVILAWQLLCFEHVHRDASGFEQVLRWLWSYGVATGPWTAYALRVGRFRRTLVGIRAYAGHLAYWLLSILVLLFGLSPAAAAPAMLLPAILPFVVGMLLAVADREALTNVRV